jgi:hypothetical protein
VIPVVVGSSPISHPKSEDSSAVHQMATGIFFVVTDIRMDLEQPETAAGA